MSEQSEKMIVSPVVCAWADVDHDNYKIEIQLPGVDKETIKLKMHEDSYFIKGETDAIVYIGSYAVCCEVKPEEAKAEYKNGLLKIEVPFRKPMEGAIEVKIEWNFLT